MSGATAGVAGAEAVAATTAAVRPMGAAGFWRRLAAAAGLLAAVGAVVGLSIRYLARDAGPVSRYVFLLPPLAVGPIGLVGAAMARAGRWWRVALAGAVVASWLPNLALDQPLLWRGSQAGAAAAGDLTVLTWNVMSYNLGAKRVANFVAGVAPDVIVLNEGAIAGTVPDIVKTTLGRPWQWLVARRLIVGTCLPILASDQVVDTPHLKLFRVVLDTPGGPLTLLAADLNSPRSRLDAKAFGQLGGALAAMDAAPAILTGDFNVPRGSVHLGGALAGWDDAFVAGGAHRLLGSWPSFPCALWQIDHTFCRGIEPVSARIGSVVASDHLPLIVSFRPAQE